MKPESITAGDVLAAVADTGSFRSWVIPGEALDAGAEAVQIGEVRIRGRRVAVIISDFACQAGSLGRATANRIVGALRTAAALDLPVFASPASGGTRIDEGTPAFVKMIDIAAAARAHRESGQVMVVWVRHPTTGGTMATWASLGQITFGQPGATAGFLGPRLFEPLIGRSLPDGVQTTDNLARVGIIDGLLGLDELRPVLDRTLSVTTGSPGEAVAGSGEAAQPAVNAEGLAGLFAASSEVTELLGTGAGERSAAVRVALARVAGQRCVIVGQDRLAQSGGDPLGPGALRFARRGIRLADELRLPLVTVIDTEGGELSAAAEERALAGEIARCLAD
ncbi:MAG: carboxyl transferase domain-containing protein, partial [Candidatus Nanopelagicales bacterium]|nr:carboxyl transferase domain-containing protein [Candidatus Nanopelagicales bacterium]